MAKDIYTRATQKANLLKKVIIRIDYTGLVTAGTFVDMTKQWLLEECFDSLFKRFIGQAKLNFSDIGNIARTLMIPVQDLRNEPLYVFSGTPFRGTNDTVTMEVSAFYTAIEITCHDYRSIDPYQTLMTAFVNRFFEVEKTLKITRLGIRKASGELFDDYEALEKVYEHDLFNGVKPDDTLSLINQEYLDCFFNKERDIKVNYKRAVSSVLDSERKHKLQAGLDIDVYIDNEIIIKTGVDMKGDFKTVFSKLNDYQFILYRNSVTEDYLASTNHE